MLASHADGIEDSKAGKAWADQHVLWAVQMPRDVGDLWAFVVELDHDSRMALFAHCAALTVNAVRLPSERRPRAVTTADRLAEAVSLDMTTHWTPTVRTCAALAGLGDLVNCRHDLPSGQLGDGEIDVILETAARPVRDVS